MGFANKHVHFIGIGGVSMSALARLLEHEGAIVTGSDINLSGHKAKNIHKDLDLVVFNGAIVDDNVELRQAQKLGLKILSREELLAGLESRYTNRIAVAGAHGKSTTTAMIAAVLCAGGLNPTVHNGVPCNNLIIGGKNFFVTEACEFKRSFLHLSPTVTVVTNIDADHLDCYDSIEEIKQVFADFTAKAGKVFFNADCKNCLHLRGTSFGEKNGDIYAENICEYKPGRYSFRLNNITIKLKVVGRHNVSNALAAIAVGKHFGISLKTIAIALERFGGVARRFQKIGRIEGCDLIIDYAHHPAEIETTIKTAQSLYGQKRFLIVFQPHTYTRTFALFDEFVKVLSNIDCVLFKTYAAREKAFRGGTANDLALACGKKYFTFQDTLNNFILSAALKFDAIILTGAGDINKVVDNLL